MDHLANKQIIIFAAGETFEDYMLHFSESLPPHLIVDNNPEKWGTKKLGYMIQNPETLMSMVSESVHIVICSVYVQEIEKQLKGMGIHQYSIYVKESASIALPAQISSPTEKSKPYRRGYIAGVFDLFHVGHLNLLQKASDRCDYLVVGVLSDELVIHFKQIKPFIPFEERQAIIQSIQYVNEVVPVSMDNIDKFTAWKLYKFDCIFSGDDWKDSQSWKEDQEKLQRVGSNLEFFPYTKGTSSTQIRALIQQTID
jgi:glycerol-3-phosphate cytidylyltransferase